jgi:hypothetical protein
MGPAAAAHALTPLRRRPPAGRAVLAMVSGVLVLAGGCHSGGTPAAKRPFAAYRACLEQHGVEPRRRRDTSTTTAPAAGETTTSTTRPDPAAFAAARQACRKLRPAGGLRAGGIGAGARAAFRKCMTDHGVTLPAEAPGAGGAPATTGPGGERTTTTSGPSSVPRGGMLAGLNRNDPTVAAALSACRPLLNAASSSTTTTTRK